MTADVVSFPTKPKSGLFDPVEAGAKVADNEHNREARDGQGPPIGSTAWVCNHCQCFAFYITAAAFHCYECHREQAF